MLGSLIIADKMDELVSAFIMGETIDCGVVELKRHTKATVICLSKSVIGEVY